MQGAAGTALIMSVTGGNASGTDIQVEQTLLIGRQATGIGKLANDTDISRRHALISRTAQGGYVIQDLGSTNGTFVNKRRIASPEPLAAGDTIAFGNTTVVVRSAGIPQPDAAGQAGAAESRPDPRVALQIEIDLERREASIALDDGSDRVDLVHEDGRWRIVTGR